LGDRGLNSLAERLGREEEFLKAGLEIEREQ